MTYRGSINNNIITIMMMMMMMMMIIIGTLGLIKKGLQEHKEKISGAICINELQQLHTKEGSVLKARFISPAVVQGHGLDSGLQEKSKNSRIQIIIIIIIIIIITIIIIIIIIIIIVHDFLFYSRIEFV